jgi:hypothetical protein
VHQRIVLEAQGYRIRITTIHNSRDFPFTTQAAARTFPQVGTGLGIQFE